MRYARRVTTSFAPPSPSPTTPPTPAQLTTGLESCGLAAADTAAVLSRIAAGQSLKEVTRRIAEGTLLRKRSPKGRQHFTAALRRRYLAPKPPLAAPEVLAAALHEIAAPIARNQILMPYLLMSDRGACEVVTDWALANREAGARITTGDVTAQLDRVFAHHDKKAWSPSLRLRWAQGVLSVLRDVGAVGKGGKREQFLAYTLRAEAFAFHLWGLYDAGHRGSGLTTSPFWRLLFLREPEAREHIRAVVERRWWRFTSVGGIDQVLPVHASVQDWLTHGLG